LAATPVPATVGRKRKVQTNGRGNGAATS